MLVLIPAFNDFNGSVLPYKWLTMCGVWIKGLFVSSTNVVNLNMHFSNCKCLTLWWVYFFVNTTLPKSFFKILLIPPNSSNCSLFSHRSPLPFPYLLLKLIFTFI